MCYHEAANVSVKLGNGRRMRLVLDKALIISVFNNNECFLVCVVLYKFRSRNNGSSVSNHSCL